MWRITTFTGTVLEVHRFINTESRIWERQVCRERRELWLGASQDDERKFVIHTQLMPARKTHCVTLVLAGSTVLGLYNQSTAAQANYVREDPPYLTRVIDILVVLALIAAGFFGMVLGWLSAAQMLGVPVICLIFAILHRVVRRKRLGDLVDDVLNELEVRQVLRPTRRADTGR